jgi:hypothetical protein
MDHDTAFLLSHKRGFREMKGKRKDESSYSGGLRCDGVRSDSRSGNNERF